MHRLASTVSTGAALCALMTITGSAHAGVIESFHLIDGHNVPLIDDNGDPVNGYWYGPSPCINDSLDGSYFIGFNRYTPVDDDDFDKEFCGDTYSNPDILNELHVIQNDGTIHWMGSGHHPVLTDGNPLILYWEMTSATEGETWIDPTLDPDSRGNGCKLGTSYEEDPDKNASCQFTDTVGMPTLDAELGRSLVLASDVAVHAENNPSIGRPCTSGIFEIRLPALSEEENWESCTPGDFNNDGVVDGSDFSVILINFRATGCNIADIASVGSPTIWEPDGVVDFTDFSAFLVAYGKECR